ncbi:hypothetical protein BJ912DRAFT_985258, partial [Pholiota molesta]
MAIADFPVELILEIASHLTYDDSYDHTNLALTCRHIYAILIPGILEDRLQYLMSSFRNKMGFLLCGYDNGHDAMLEPFGGSYRMLQFQPGDSKKEFLCIQSIITRAKDLDAVHIRLGDRKTSIRNLAALINSCSMRPALSLTISGTISSQWHHEYDGPDADESGTGPFKIEFIGTARPDSVRTPRNRDRKTYVNMLISFLKRVLLIRRSSTIHNAPPQINSGALAIAVPHRPTVKLSLGPQCQLTSLRIASDDLFLPSFYPFTKNLLNTAKITTLSLSGLRVNLLAWTEILPALTIPTLREFCMGNVSITFPDLLKFLGRRCHQSIELLDFTGNDPIGIVKISPLSILSRLSSFTANAEYLIPFLQSRNEGNFPALQYLGISAPRAPLDTMQNELNAVYELILNGPPFMSINVDSIANSGMVEWIVKTSAKWPPGNPFTELKLFSFSDQGSIPQKLLDVLAKWEVQNIPSEGQDKNSTMLAISDPEKALKQFFSKNFP